MKNWWIVVVVIALVILVLVFIILPNKEIGYGPFGTSGGEDSPKKDHQTAVSSTTTWPHDHTESKSDTWPGEEHWGQDSNTWPEDHETWNSETWPAGHRYEASSTWPDKPYGGIPPETDGWPSNHEGEPSSTWEGSEHILYESAHRMYEHEKELSKTWPANHIYQESKDEEEREKEFDEQDPTYHKSA